MVLTFYCTCILLHRHRINLVAAAVAVAVAAAAVERGNVAEVWKRKYGHRNERTWRGVAYGSDYVQDGEDSSPSSSHCHDGGRHEHGGC